MNILGAFKGEYLTAVGFDGQTPTLTIDHVQLVDLEGEDGQARSKPVVYFREDSPGWVLCKTTAQALSAMFGAETDRWTGKRVTLHAIEVQVGAERKPGIRVKGSPDLTQPVTFELRMPRKKPQKVTLVPTEAPASGKKLTADALWRACVAKYGPEAKMEWTVAVERAGIPSTTKSADWTREQLGLVEQELFGGER